MSAHAHPALRSTSCFHLVGENGLGFSRGGMGMISQSIADSGRRFGMEIKTEAAVREILVENGRAVGVVTEDGDEYRSKLVSCNVSASLTFGRLVEEKHLPAPFLREIKQFRNKGSAFKMNLAVDKAPQYKGFDPLVAGIDYPAYAHIGPTTEYLERAFDDAKYGWYSTRPAISPIVPSMIDDSLAPAGKHVVTLYGVHAPYSLKGASWDDERDSFVSNVMATMDEFAPGFSSSILDMQVLLPPDIERILGIPGGHELHGEVALDQLFFMRPASKYADYRSPVRGALPVWRFHSPRWRRVRGPGPQCRTGNTERLETAQEIRSFLTTGPGRPPTFVQRLYRLRI